MALTDVEAVRLKIGDTDSAIFTDAEIEHFLGENGSDTDLAAADALEAMASNAAWIAKLQKTGEFTVDRKEIPKALLASAAALRTKAREAPALSVSEWDITDAQAAGIAAKAGESVKYK